MIYFRFYLKAYDTATDELSMLEHGAYLSLMRKYYKDEKALPLNSDVLARACRAISLEERAAIAAVLDRFFVQRADGWHNERADHEIDVSRKARENGSRGGRPRADDDDSDDPPECHVETERVTEHKTELETGNITGDRTGSGHPSSLSTKTILSTSYPANQPLSARAARGGRKSRPEGETTATWDRYREAYVHRYGVPPIRNARVNGQLAALIRNVGIDKAPEVAAFYLTHNRADYVRAQHPTSFLARDAEGLHTAWATDTRTSDAEARQADRTMGIGNAFAPLIEAAKAGR